MFCKHCGSKLPETAKFCPTCGKINETSEDISIVKNEPYIENAPISDYQDASAPVGAFVNVPPSQPTLAIEQPYNPYNKVYEKIVPEAQKKSGGPALTFAILGLVFGCTFFLSILGLVFSYIAKSKVYNYIVMNGQTEGAATAGKGISTAGLIVSWILSAIFVFYFLIIVVILGAL